MKNPNYPDWVGSSFLKNKSSQYVSTRIFSSNCIVMNRMGKRLLSKNTN